MSAIFIGYRREDSEGPAGGLFRDLSERSVQMWCSRM
jgi:hypothetical protein